MADWIDVSAELPPGVTVQTCGAGRPIILIAGNGGGIGFWSPLADHMNGYQLVGFDYRDAPKRNPDGSLFETAVQKAADLPQIMQAIGLSSAVILGHSTGAQAALRFASDHPDLVEHLVLSGGYAAPHVFITKSMTLRKEILTTMGPDAFMLDSLYRAIPPAQLFAQMEEQGADALLSFRESPDVELESDRIDQIIHGDVTEPIEQLNARHFKGKITVLHAQNDSVFPASLGEALAQALDGATFVSLAEGSHLAPMLEPALYADVLKERLTL